MSRFVYFLVFIFFGGLIYFFQLIPDHQENSDKKTDATIVLTGGMHRIEEGLKQLSDQHSKKLFISGVYDQTKLTEILTLNEKQVFNLLIKKPNVELGKRAQTTKGNALECYEWIKNNNIKSIRLVTSSYHMPRSIFEFKRILPNVKIIPNPVFTSNFQKHNWWKHLLTSKLILKEYVKFVYIISEYYLAKFKNEFL